MFMLFIILGIINIFPNIYPGSRLGIGAFLIRLFAFSIFGFTKNFIGFGLFQKRVQNQLNKYVPNHANKQNTPTMGGIVFVLSTIVSVLLTAISQIYIFDWLIT